MQSFKRDLAGKRNLWITPKNWISNGQLAQKETRPNGPGIPYAFAAQYNQKTPENNACLAASAPN
jgi:hypothetical protein